MQIQIEQLELPLRAEVRSMVDAAQLSAELPWGAGIKVENLAEMTTPADRFNDGKFAVTYGTERWVLDGGVSLTGASVWWDTVIDSDTGTVLARPRMKDTLVDSGPEGQIGANFDYVKFSAHFGFAPRVIGNLGPLLPLLPPSAGAIAHRFSIPKRYGSFDEVRRIRGILATLFTNKDE